jgi:hypothetical protein
VPEQLATPNIAMMLMASAPRIMPKTRFRMSAFTASSFTSRRSPISRISARTAATSALVARSAIAILCRAWPPVADPRPAKIR